MNKFLKVIIVSLVLTFISCEKTELTQNDENTTASKAPTNPPNVGYSDVIALTINNGIPLNTDCTKNILVFPSWARFYQVEDYLDQQTETYCDAFDAQQPIGQTEQQYDDACLAANFDEDNKLLQFENNKAFCSLRKKIIQDEDIWLTSLGNGDWSPIGDPDNHFIDDTQRSMFNEGVEVIIGLGTRENPYKIYKFNEDGSYYVISNMNTTALQQINNGTYTPNSSSDVIKLIDPKPVPPVDCKYSNTIRNDFSDGSTTYWIKTVDKFTHNTLLGSAKMKSKTVHYKKGGVSLWRKKRGWITAGLYSTVGIECGGGNTPNSNIKHKRRKKLIVKWTSELGTNNPGVIDEGTFGVHRRGTFPEKNIDLYNYPPQ